jgi:hypothetical protein
MIFPVVLAAVIFSIKRFLVLAFLIVAEIALGTPSAMYTGKMALKVKGARNRLRFTVWHEAFINGAVFLTA